MTWFYETFQLVFRQRWAIERGVAALRSVFTPQGAKGVFAAILCFIQSLNFVLFGTPLPASDRTADLTGYELVFCDEFNGDSLDTDAWRYRSTGARRGGFDAPGQVAVRDGSMVITAEYLTDGAYGEGWYTGNVSLREWYERGYFEIRCKCSDGGAFWSAFWLQGSNSYDHGISAGGPGSAEIDIFEAMSADKKLPLMRNAVTSTIHCNGSDDDAEQIDSRELGTFRANDIYDTFNTYALEWTQDEYIFYINGRETTRSSFGSGVSRVPEEVIVSLESPDVIGKQPGHTTRFEIDYVKIYQKP